MHLLLRAVPAQSNARVKGAPKGSIEADEFAAFKKCIEELQFMNEQYNKFKKSSKANKNKSEKFMNFYQKCKKKGLEPEESEPESRHSAQDIGSLAKKRELVNKCQNLLPDELPEGVDSVKSEDVSNQRKSLLPGQDPTGQVRIWIFWNIFKSLIFRLI